MQADDGDGQNIQNSIEGYIRTRTGEKGAVTPEDFPWRWGIVYGENPAALPPYEGKTAAVLADRPEDGKAYILYHEPSGCTLSARGDSGSLDGVPVPARGDTLADSLPEDALVFTAHVNGEGLVSFTIPDGRILSCARGGGVLLSDSPSEDGMDLWRLEEAPGCWYIVCAGSENSLALEYYSGRFTTFRLSESGAYLFNFYSPAE